MEKCELIAKEDAIKMAKADLKCMERDTSGQDEMCNSHKCDECSLNYERGNIGEQKEWLRLAIKALEQEPRKGHWEETTYSYHYYNDGEIETEDLRCSCCQEYTEWDISLPHKPYYCPNCGADMREE